jgi:pimeloyl-ACP methyl ester carboxylesterase
MTDGRFSERHQSLQHSTSSAKIDRMIQKILIFFSICALQADGPADNRADKVRPVPPPGLPIPAAEREQLTRGLDELRSKLTDLQSQTNKEALLADVKIFFNAIDYALRYDEWLNGTNDLPNAHKLLKQGLERAAELVGGKPSWTNASGLVVRGYISNIDRSVQPYGLVVPPSYSASPERLRRLDVWFHGRDEKLTELKFLTDRQRSGGEFVPVDAFVLHLYGRYCNANKFAGEIDLFEALADVKQRYRIDDDRIVVRGFSMGGAACWQFAVHYPGEWAAAAPGAGFAETKEFLRVFQNEPVAPQPWEQKLWRWYDCPEYAVNLFNLPVVAYSGEIDRQKQAADVMAEALQGEGIQLTHVIGPKTGHSYHPEAKREINQRIDALANKGRDPLPRFVKFATHTLRYNKSHWITLHALEQHWEQARIDAEITPKGIHGTTKNIAALTFDIAPGLAPFSRPPEIEIDGQTLRGAALHSDRSWRGHLRKQDGRWSFAGSKHADGLAKRPGLQGPIDDAFMDSFIMVLPTGSAQSEAVSKWVEHESRHAIEHWRKLFRGEARVMKDTELTTNEIASANLILWGDPASNSVLDRIADELPIKWNKDGLQFGGKSYVADKNVAALIYPNPLNPNRYVVLNSGFTFREYDYLNNARQVAKLPDYAIIDITVPPNSRYPGKIADAGFFDEKWRIPLIRN